MSLWAPVGRWGGSSPLARGLPPDWRAGVGQPRIIPARAGFTSNRTHSASPRGDHPRSRGVYTFAWSTRIPSRGSSPLARGLLAVPAGRPGLQGDHPRSRGVYPRRWYCSDPCSGSSPLARGLLVKTLIVFVGTGIIPARAGFTSSWPCRPWSPGDHPRSRGVYDRRAWRGQGDEGSSPLARGLPVEAAERAVPDRIIPARAGFTGASSGEPSLSTDHPRSRGVYKSSVRVTHRRAGSSPLARGLRGPRGPRRGWPRIIPARAGFTEEEREERRSLPDHPRSRGVYSSERSASPRPRGSSPLARGLHGIVEAAKRAVRIIPARAGFTPPRSSRRWPSTDHPRSRGVYQISGMSSRPGPGSSPLARGLRIVDTNPVRVSRIIPARAGFTGPHSVRPSPGPDHPRSRGVYTHFPDPETRCSGSSPLARGLHLHHSGNGVDVRIIPARAGFTCER